MIENHLIVGIHISDRIKRAGDVQAVFTEFGCNIRTRIGLHDADGVVCSPSGVVLLELVGAESDCDAMVARLEAIEGVEARKMAFNHE